MQPNTGAVSWAILKDGVWQVGVHLSNVGHNTVVIWAEDLAEPVPNSGAGMEGPHELTVDIVWDPPWTPERISPEGRTLLGIR